MEEQLITKCNLIFNFDHKSTCVFEINQHKITPQYVSKVGQASHIHTHFDKIYRLVRDPTEFGSFFKVWHEIVKPCIIR